MVWDVPSLPYQEGWISATTVVSALRPAGLRRDDSKKKTLGSMGGFCGFPEGTVMWRGVRKSYRRAEGRVSLVLLAVSLLFVCLAEKSWAAPADPIFNDPEYQLYIQQLVIRAETNCMVPVRGWGEKQRQIREGLKRSFGMDLRRTWPALEPRVESTLARNGYHIDQVSAQFWPGVRYAMQAYVPDGKGPFPAILLVATGTTAAIPVALGVVSRCFSSSGGLCKDGHPRRRVSSFGKGRQAQSDQYGHSRLLAGTSVAEKVQHR